MKNRIVLDPDVMVGKPVIKGTRITVEMILRQLSQGISIDELLDNYPHLTRKDVYAAIAYASERMIEDRIYSLKV
ncbi:MAG: DUF433 domain-containing protein [Cytophagales bacterium]|nr:DUF433 domain-containing protein [Cytophagales bacterium]